MGHLKQKVAKGAVWTLMEKLSCQIVQFGVAMVLARLLTPEDYGTVALMSIFFSVAGVLVDGGFGDALIQKKEADDLDFNSVFYLNVVLSLLAYAALFFAARWIADFYKTPELVGIVRVAAITLVFNAVNAIQNAELTKKMLFHLSFRISIISSLTSAITGVTLAFLGFGVWALVYSTLLGGFSGVIARWFIIAWRPRLMFSLSRLRPLFDYGWKMSVSALLDQFFGQLSGLLIGKFYTKADLAYVGRGNSLPNLAMSQVDGTIGRVSFPALVEMQDDRVRLRETMRRMMVCSTFLVFPLMVGIAACSESLILLLFGSQWKPAVPYMMIACFSYALYPFHTINLKGIQALGRSDIFLKLEIIKKLLKLVVIFAAFRFGVLVFVMVSAFAFGPLGVLVNAWPNRKLLNYSIAMQVADVLPTAAICLVEGAAVFGVNWVLSCLCIADGFSGWRLNVFFLAKLIFQLVLGAGIFVGLAYAFRLKPMGEYVKLASRVIDKRFPRLAELLKRRFQA